MRKVVLAVVLVFAGMNCFADSVSCTSPYVALDGVPGDGVAPCQGAFKFSSVNLSQPAGQKAPTSITIVKTLDKASPKLYLDCASGAHISKGTVMLATSEVLKLSNVVITSWSQSGDGNGNVQESLTLNFGKIEWDSGSTSTTVSTWRGTAMSGAGGTVAVVGENGESAGKVQHFEISVRPGGAVTTSIRLQPTGPLIKSGMVRPSAAAAPQPHMSSGFIQIGGAGGASLNLHFNGGTLLNGNLRAQKVNLAPATAVLRQ